MKEDSTNVQENQTQQSAVGEQENNSSVELNVQDLQNLKEIIDVASTRGAFRPKEMMAVGAVYTKLENFLMAVAAQQKQGE